MDAPFKDLIDAIHDIKRTVALDGGQFIASNHTIWLTQQQWDALILDPYVLTLPTSAVDDLVAHKVLGVNVLVRP